MLFSLYIAWPADKDENTVLILQVCSRNANNEMPVPVAWQSKTSVCGRSPNEIVGSNPTGDMDVCCVLSGRGLCDELITRPEESYRLYCVVECDLETSGMSRPLASGETQSHRGKINK